MSRVLLGILLALTCVNSRSAGEQPDVELLLADLGGDDPYRADNAALLLGGMPEHAEKSIPALIDALHDDRPADDAPFGLSAVVSARAAAALFQLGPASIPQLTEKLREESSATYDVIELLAKFGAHAKPALPRLQQIAKSNSSDKLYALHATFEINIDGNDRVSLPLELLGDRSPDVRGLAARQLSELGPLAAAAVPSLIVLLQDAANRTHAISNHFFVERAVRFDVATALGEIGPAARNAVSRLQKLMVADPDSEVRAAAALAILQIKGDDSIALEKLIELAEADQQGLAGPRAAIVCLERLGPRATAALDALQRLIRHEDSLIRIYATQAIAAIGQRESLPLLETMLNDEDDLVRKNAEEAVAKLKDSSKSR